MIACDRCKSKEACRTAVVFKKYDGKNRLGREMLKVEHELCEPCITELLKAFGKFKVAFMKDADEPDPKPEKS